MADFCRVVEVKIGEDNEVFSDRVCNPCFRKIRNLGTLYELVQSSLGSEAGTTPQQSEAGFGGKRSLLVPIPHPVSSAVLLSFSRLSL